MPVLTVTLAVDTTHGPLAPYFLLWISLLGSYRLPNPGVAHNDLENAWILWVCQFLKAYKNSWQMLWLSLETPQASSGNPSPGDFSLLSFTRTSDKQITAVLRGGLASEKVRTQYPPRLRGAHAGLHPSLETPKLATTEQDRVAFEPQQTNRFWWRYALCLHKIHFQPLPAVWQPRPGAKNYAKSSFFLKPLCLMAIS